MDRLLARIRGARDGLALPALGAFVLLLASGGAARLAARGEEGGDPPLLCGRHHPGRGDSAPLDLRALERAYGATKGAVELRLGDIALDPERAIGKSVDLGLPACRGRDERHLRLKAELPEAFRKAALRFVRGRDGVSETVARDPDAEILLVSADSLRSLGEFSRALGRGVTLAPPRLVQALGVRCAPTRVTFSEDGDHAILAEGE